MLTTELKLLEAPSLKELVELVNESLKEGWSMRGETRSGETHNASRTKVTGCVFSQVMAWVELVEPNESRPAP
jgi:hypothetical protein